MDEKQSQCMKQRGVKTLQNTGCQEYLFVSSKFKVAIANPLFKLKAAQFASLDNQRKPGKA